MAPAPPTAVVGQRLTGERADDGVAGAQLTEHTRNRGGVERRLVLEAEQQRRDQRCNHGKSRVEAPPWMARLRGRLYYLGPCVPVCGLSFATSSPLPAALGGGRGPMRLA